MLAIPASEIVAVNPGVIGAGGTGLDLIGLVLTTNTRVPTGVVMSFGSALAVSAFFGPAAVESALAQVYFLGSDNSPIKPGAMLFAQYPQTAAVAPYVRGGNISGLTLAQLQALAPGTLTVVLNGVGHTSGTINLASATSFSNAATIIQTALGANDASFTAAIAASTGSFTGSIADGVLTITAVSSGVVVVGGILTGTAVAAGTQVLAQLTGTPGGVGTYQVSPNGQTVPSTTISETYGTLTVSAVASGALAPGQALAGAGITAGTVVTALGTGVGGVGTYIVSPTQTVGSEAMTAGAASVTFDSTSGGFVITGGTPGAVGTIAYPSGAMAAPLLLTQTTGATLSQGAPLATPNAFMNTLIQQTQNWFSFMTVFDPVKADKLAFASWANAQNVEFCYVEWAMDAANTLPNPQTATAAIIAANYSGTFPIYAPGQTNQQAAMVMGFFASIDFTRPNGRETLAFRSETGQLAEVTNQGIADQLRANGLNYYGTYSTQSDSFTFLYPGSVTGPFKWADSFANAVWLKAAMQQALMSLLTQVPSIPYNSNGFGLIDAALADPIEAAVSFGAIRAGVTLSNAQTAEVNNAAGVNIATTLQNRGWYLQILDPGAQVRGNRGSPVITLWYMDGESVQQITMQSLTVL